MQRMNQLRASKIYSSFNLKLKLLFLFKMQLQHFYSNFSFHVCAFRTLTFLKFHTLSDCLISKMDGFLVKIEIKLN